MLWPFNIKQYPCVPQVWGFVWVIQFSVSQKKNILGIKIHFWRTSKFFFFSNLLLIFILQTPQVYLGGYESLIIIVDKCFFVFFIQNVLLENKVLFSIICFGNHFYLILDKLVKCLCENWTVWVRFQFRRCRGALVTFSFSENTWSLSALLLISFPPQKTLHYFACNRLECMLQIVWQP